MWDVCLRLRLCWALILLHFVVSTLSMLDDDSDLLFADNSALKENLFSSIDDQPLDDFLGVSSSLWPDDATDNTDYGLLADNNEKGSSCFSSSSSDALALGTEGASFPLEARGDATTCANPGVAAPALTFPNVLNLNLLNPEDEDERVRADWEVKAYWCGPNNRPTAVYGTVPVCSLEEQSPDEFYFPELASRLRMFCVHSFLVRFLTFSPCSKRINLPGLSCYKSFLLLELESRSTIGWGASVRKLCSSREIESIMIDYCTH